MTRRPVARWVDDRVGLTRSRVALTERRAERGRYDYDIGSAVVFLLVMEVLTGVLMLMHYRASADQAHETVAAIETLLPFGSLIRGIHAWSADLLVLAAVAYAAILAFKRLYARPRELIWMTAVATVLVAIFMSFTGTLLLWTQHAYAQAQIAGSLASYVPIIGEWLSRFLLGGEITSHDTLGRAFGFHVAVLPATMTALVLVQAALVYGDRPPKRTAKPGTIPVYPDLVVRHAALWIFLLLVVVSLATFVPREVGEALDLAKPTPPHTHPAWYFMWFDGLLHLAPKEMLGVEGPRFLVVSLIAVIVALPAIPFFDPKGSRTMAWIAGLALAAMVALGIYAQVWS